MKNEKTDRIEQKQHCAAMLDVSSPHLEDSFMYMYTWELGVL